MKTLIITLSLILIASGLGCAAMSSYVTPATIDQSAVGYVIAAKVADPNDYKGYPNLLKAQELKKDVDSAHLVVQLSLQQQAQKDDLNYSIHQDVVSSNYTVAMQREETLFGETGLLSLGLSMAGMGTLTGFLGLMRKRPGDVTSIELEQTVAQATGKTVEELSAKQKQMIQLVKGVQIFIDRFKREPQTVQLTADGVLGNLKSIMNETQDTETQIAVAEIKKST